MEQIIIASEELRVLEKELVERKTRIYEYIKRERFRRLLKPKHLRDATLSYPNRTGKAFRPTGLLWCCGAAGGAEREYVGLPAAAAIEMYHTWGLIHDDIIDEDDERRGGPTVHVEFEQRALVELEYDLASARRYGLAMAILAGDAALGLTLVYLSDLFQDPRVSAKVVQLIVQRLADTYITTALEGQTYDIQFEHTPIATLTQQDLMDVAWKKTGTFFGFAGFAGSLIGINEPDVDHPYVRLLTGFANKCGIVLQLTDDVLNIIGDETRMGKPVGSDVALGKRTIPIIYALSQANTSQSDQLLSVSGNPNATTAEIKGVLRLIDDLGGPAYTKNLAMRLAQEALEDLSSLPRSKYTDLLSMWARRISHRVR